MKFGVSQSKRDIKVLERVQRRATGMGKGLEGKMGEGWVRNRGEQAEGRHGAGTGEGQAVG